MKKILLVGGTGAIGMYLAPYLLKEGFQVYITSRSDRRSTDSNLFYLRGNGKDIKWLDELSIEYTFDAIVDFMMYTTYELKSRIEKLLTFSSHYIFLSSYRSLAGEIPLNDDSLRKIDLINSNPIYKDDLYGLRKGNQEDLFIESSNKNWTIVRPPMTFSKNRFQFGAMDNWDVVRAVRGGTSVLPEGMWLTSTTLVYGKDVALMISKLVLNKRAYGKSFNLGTKENYTWQEISDIYNRIFGLKVSKIISNKEYTTLTNQTGAMIDRLLTRVFDNDKLLAVTGLKDEDFYSLEKGLKEAWGDSDIQFFKNTNHGVALHAKFDIVSGVDTKLCELPESIRKIYFIARERERRIYNNSVKLQGYEVTTINDYFWRVTQNDESVRVTTINKQSNVSGNSWVSFKLPNSLKEQQNYSALLSVNCNVEAKVRLFFHGSGERNQVVTYLDIKKGTNYLKFKFTSDFRWQYFALTRNDFDQQNVDLEFWEISIKEE